MENFLELTSSLLRTTCPLLFAALGGLFCERAGVINIALEGFLLLGAFVGAVVTLSTGSPELGFLAAASAGFFFATFYGVVVIEGRSDQVVAGIAFNLLVMGAIPLFLKILYDSSGGSPSLPIEQRFLYFPLWFVWLVGFFVWIFFSRTPMGLWVSFAGESPQALWAAGISLRRVRYFSLGMGGILTAIGGATLSLCLSSGYSRNMAAGRGFMALAALILGKWRPIPVMLACLFFGAVEVLQVWLQSSSVQFTNIIPSQLLAAIPYLATVLVLAGFIGRSRPPSHLGQSP